MAAKVLIGAIAGHSLSSKTRRSYWISSTHTKVQLFWSETCRTVPEGQVAKQVSAMSRRQELTFTEVARLYAPQSLPKSFEPLLQECCRYKALESPDKI